MTLTISHKDLADSIAELRQAEGELAELSRRVQYLRMTVDGMSGLAMLACAHTNAEAEEGRWHCLECGSRFNLDPSRQSSRTNLERSRTSRPHF